MLPFRYLVHLQVFIFYHCQFFLIFFPTITRLLAETKPFLLLLTDQKFPRHHRPIISTYDFFNNSNFNVQSSKIASTLQSVKNVTVYSIFNALLHLIKTFITFVLIIVISFVRFIQIFIQKLIESLELAMLFFDYQIEPHQHQVTKSSIPSEHPQIILTDISQSSESLVLSSTKPFDTTTDKTTI